MSKDIYRKLAQRLDATPYGFSATESGVELQLLARVFTPQEAKLVAEMRLTPEPAAEIAARAGADPGTTERTLEEMVRKGLIRAKGDQDALTFGLLAFIPGFYEQRMYRKDAAVAELFELYYRETQGGSVVHATPVIHRVIPVGEALPGGVEIFPYERASELVKGARSWGVCECVCRLQRRLVGQGCHHPLEVCLLFAPVEGVFEHSEIDRPLTQAQALDVLRQAAEAGLVHATYNYRDGVAHICNCCSCACMFLRGVVEFGRLGAVARADFIAVADTESCAGCGDCVERCQFGALSVPETVCEIEPLRCVGCGLCVTACPTGALHLERLPEGERFPLLADRQEWNEWRLRGRGISISDVS
jgi:electron transport complex protein RnfB